MKKKPSNNILNAFGATEKPKLIKGGQGMTYRSGSIVFKPADWEVETVWIANLMSKIEENGFRVARPVNTVNGKWFYEGWSAWAYIEGKEFKGKWKEKLSIARKFHKAISKYPKPSFIERANHPWAISDKMVWGDIPLSYTQKLDPIIPRLQKLLKPIRVKNQLIHGDMTGNILFHNSLPPAVIDFSPYWRPANFALATIVIESIVWEGAPSSLLKELENTFEMNQLIIRAVMWLVKSTEEYERKHGPTNLEYKVKKYNEFVDIFIRRLNNQK